MEFIQKYNNIGFDFDGVLHISVFYDSSGQGHPGFNNVKILSSSDYIPNLKITNLISDLLKKIKIYISLQLDPIHNLII